MVRLPNDKLMGTYVLPNRKGGPAFLISDSPSALSPLHALHNICINTVVERVCYWRSALVKPLAVLSGAVSGTRVDRNQGPRLDNKAYDRRSHYKTLL